MDELCTELRSLLLVIDESTGKLNAQFDPAEGAPVPDLAILRKTLRECGFDNLYLDERALANFINACRQADKPIVLEVGERRDAEFSLKLDDEMMAAWLTLMPEYGGKPIGTAVGVALEKHGVIHGILHEALDAALVAGKCENLQIVRGDNAKEGTAGRFEILFGNNDGHSTEADERAVIKLIDLSHLLVVHPGDRLMRRIPPTPGVNGVNFKGQVILAKVQPEMPFGANLQGAAPDPDDPDILLATCGGQPVATDDGVIVNPVIEVSNIDLKTGNVSFEGTIHVKGDVKVGMCLKVTGDVIVNGTIEAAEIVAGGNVAVKCGIIGHADSKPGARKLGETAARIRCGGSVQAMFMENAHIEAGDSIHIERSALQCELIARNEIVAGKAGSKAGQITGGRAQATLLVKAMVLGAVNGMKTLIQVGIDPYLEEEILKKKNLLQRKLAELDQVLKLILFFNHNPKKGEGGVKEKVDVTRRQLVTEIETAQLEITQMHDQLELVDQARVTVDKGMHDGVEIRIGKHDWSVLEEIGRGSYKLEDGEIVSCE